MNRVGSASNITASRKGILIVSRPLVAPMEKKEDHGFGKSLNALEADVCQKTTRTGTMISFRGSSGQAISAFGLSSNGH